VLYFLFSSSLLLPFFFVSLNVANTSKEFAKSAKGVKKTTKTISTKAFLDDQMDQFHGEIIASLDGANSDGTSKGMHVLPYEILAQFYEEYLLQCEVNGTPEDEIAHYTCFRDVFRSYRKRIKLLRCKGSFPTCDVCNTALTMLRDTKQVSRIIYYSIVPLILTLYFPQ
jgi:hypothetical protein